MSEKTQGEHKMPFGHVRFMVFKQGEFRKRKLLRGVLRWWMIGMDRVYMTRV